MAAVIGIDLGTSTTEAAVYVDGHTEMIVNFSGNVITPSVLGINPDGKWIIGEDAKAQALLYPEKTAMEVKRKIGTGEKITVDGKDYTAQDLSAKLLRHVRKYVSKALGEKVTRAVISVPAYFNDIQRQETVQAGRKAGFEVDRILNEPTAAALSYGLDHMDEESHILVYDLGGGTFDVTLLEMFEGVLEVKASSGDNQLGGKDFDEKLMDYLIRQFQRKNSVDLASDHYAMMKLKAEAESCKMALSTQDSYQILIPMIAKKGKTPLAMEETITREMFENLTKELIERTHHPIEVVLQDSGLTQDQIDKIILVGGSTRMPMVAKDIEAFLHQKPAEAVNPDYAVAEGAAVQAAIIDGRIDAAEGLIITDVNPYTLGVRVVDGYNDDDIMSVIIPRNVTIPTSRNEIYTTAADNQTQAAIEVFQGESSVATNNNFLGEFTVTGIPRKAAGKEQILVDFAYDLNGMLSVTATIVSTGKNASIQINMSEVKKQKKKKEINPYSRDLDSWMDYLDTVFGADDDFDEDDIADFMKDVFDMDELGDDEDEEEEPPVDVSDWKSKKDASAYRALIRRAERTLSKLDPKGEQHHLLNDAIYNLKAAICLGTTPVYDMCERSILMMLDLIEETDA
ncbi:MAG: Hsp70 family protein [Blautia sp.]|nr:Hsp70 family protein [Blautia sp.]